MLSENGVKCKNWLRMMISSCIFRKFDKESEGWNFICLCEFLVRIIFCRVYIECIDFVLKVNLIFFILVIFIEG